MLVTLAPLEVKSLTVCTGVLVLHFTPPCKAYLYGQDSCSGNAAVQSELNVITHLLDSICMIQLSP